ncbi:hypothetical protein [Streptomyces phytohabitans]|uniref:hypothetical protein n=1 Tax=Streptomyces phytohabitans TaxID=1150371 RepID=UPI00345B984F
MASPTGPSTAGHPPAPVEPPAPRPRPDALLVAAHVELASLLALLANLATVHAPAVSSLLGPTHGCAYVFVCGAAVRAGGGARTRAAALALVPGVGGLLSRRHLTHHLTGRRTSRPAPRQAPPPL